MRLSTNLKDVFNTVYEEIGLLENSITSEQQQADSDIESERATCTSSIETLELVEASAQNQYDTDKDAREQLENEAAKAESDKADLEERYQRNLNRIDELSTQRCDDAMLFVRDLMSHKEALELLKLLQGELVAYFAEPSNESLISIMTKVELLQAYSKIFKGKEDVLAQVR